jgi:hypothetical protein
MQRIEIRDDIEVVDILMPFQRPHQRELQGPVSTARKAKAVFLEDAIRIEFVTIQ